MTNAKSTINDACDLLARTEHELSFIQSITLLTGLDEALTLESDQVSGLYYVLDNARKNIRKAFDDISNATKI